MAEEKPSNDSNDPQPAEQQQDSGGAAEPPPDPPEPPESSDPSEPPDDSDDPEEPPEDEPEGEGDGAAPSARTQYHLDRIAENGDQPIEEVAQGGRPTRSAARIAERRVRVWEYCGINGMPVESVAEQLNVSAKTVYDDLAHIRNRAAGEWTRAKSSPEHRMMALADITLRLDTLFNNAMLAAADSVVPDMDEDGNPLMDGFEIDRKAHAAYMRIALEATRSKYNILDNAGCLPKSTDGMAHEQASFEINLRASLGLKEAPEDLKVSPQQTRRVLETVRLLVAQKESLKVS